MIFFLYFFDPLLEFWLVVFSLGGNTGSGTKGRVQLLLLSKDWKLYVLRFCFDLTTLDLYTP